MNYIRRMNAERVFTSFVERLLRKDGSVKISVSVGHAGGNAVISNVDRVTVQIVDAKGKKFALDLGTLLAHGDFDSEDLETTITSMGCDEIAEKAGKA